MKKEVIMCDGCGCILKGRNEIYHLDLRTERFWDGVEMNDNLIRLDFCEACAYRIKEVLEKIAKSEKR